MVDRNVGRAGEADGDAQPGRDKVAEVALVVGGKDVEVAVEVEAAGGGAELTVARGGRVLVVDPVRPVGVRHVGGGLGDDAVQEILGHPHVVGPPAGGGDGGAARGVVVSEVASGVGRVVHVQVAPAAGHQGATQLAVRSAGDVGDAGGDHVVPAAGGDGREGDEVAGLGGGGEVLVDVGHGVLGLRRKHGEVAAELAKVAHGGGGVVDVEAAGGRLGAGGGAADASRQS